MNGSTTAAYMASVTVNTTGLFVAVGNNGSQYPVYATSTNGSTWTTPATYGVSYQTVTSIAVNTTGLFVSMSYNSSSQPAYAYSTNGSAWITPVTITTTSAVPSADMYSIVYSNALGLFVAVGDTGSSPYSSYPTYATSTNGSTWTSPAYMAYITALLQGVAAFNYQTVAVGYDTSNYPVYTTAMLGAQRMGGSLTVAYMKAVARGSSPYYWASVGWDVSGYPLFAYSTVDDGSVWTAPASMNGSTTVAYMTSIAYGSPAGSYVAVGYNASNYPAYATSTNGSTWTTPVLMNGYTGYARMTSIAYSSFAAGLFVAVGYNGNGYPVYATSANGSTWTTPVAMAGSTTYARMTGVVWNSNWGGFIATGYNNSNQTVQAYSQTGIVWTVPTVLNTSLQGPTTSITANGTVLLVFGQVSGTPSFATGSITLGSSLIYPTWGYTPSISGSTYQNVNYPRVVVQKWHGSKIRAGIFDDKDGVFVEYDGNQLWAVKRNSTMDLVGRVSIAVNSNLVTGDTNTRFRDQLIAGDQVIIRGMTHTISLIVDQTHMYVTPVYRGVINAQDVRYTTVKEERTPQKYFNYDRADGSGPSGYVMNLTKMQMIGIQFTWYGAGFVDYMVRGTDGRMLTMHRSKGNNVNDEAFMRTGNLPARYQASNKGPRTWTNYTILPSATEISLNDASEFPNATATSSAITVAIDNEFITYTGGPWANGNITGLVRGASLTTVELGSNVAKYMGSNAGTSWIGQGLPLGASADWQAMVFAPAPSISAAVGGSNPGLWVAVGGDTAHVDFSNQTAYSYDGHTWYVGPIVGSTAICASMAYGQISGVDYWVIAPSTLFSNYYWTTNPISGSWNAGTALTANGTYVAFGYDENNAPCFVWVSSNNTTSYSSFSGGYPTSLTAGGTLANAPTSIAFGTVNGINYFVVVTSSSSLAVSSNGGKTWTAISTTALTGSSPQIAFGAGVWVMLGGSASFNYIVGAPTGSWNNTSTSTPAGFVQQVCYNAYGAGSQGQFWTVSNSAPASFSYTNNLASVVNGVTAPAWTIVNSGDPSGQSYYNNIAAGQGSVVALGGYGSTLSPVVINTTGGQSVAGGISGNMMATSLQGLGLVYGQLGTATAAGAGLVVSTLSYKALAVSYNGGRQWANTSTGSSGPLSNINGYSQPWTAMAYAPSIGAGGQGRFVVVSGNVTGANTTAYQDAQTIISTPMQAWTTGGTLPAATYYQDVTYINGAFVTIANVTTTFAPPYNVYGNINTAGPVIGPMVTYGFVSNNDPLVLATANVSNGPTVPWSQNNNNLGAGLLFGSATVGTWSSYTVFTSQYSRQGISYGMAVGYGLSAGFQNYYPVYAISSQVGGTSKYSSSTVLGIGNSLTPTIMTGCQFSNQFTNGTVAVGYFAGNLVPCYAYSSGLPTVGFTWAGAPQPLVSGSTTPVKIMGVSPQVGGASNRYLAAGYFLGNNIPCYSLYNPVTYTCTAPATIGSTGVYVRAVTSNGDSNTNVVVIGTFVSNGFPCSAISTNTGSTWSNFAPMGGTTIACNMNAIYYQNSYVAVGSFNGNLVPAFSVSADGTNWNAPAVMGGTANLAVMTSVFYSNSLSNYFAVGYGTSQFSTAANNAVFATSTNGSTWSAPVAVNTPGIVAGTTLSAAYSNNGGASWNSQTTGLAIQNWSALASGYFPTLANSYVVVAISATGNSSVAVSNVQVVNGVSTLNSWQYLPSALPVQTNWTSVAYGINTAVVPAVPTFVAISGNISTTGSNATAYSTDGVSWTAGGNLPVAGYWKKVAYGANGVWVAVMAQTTAGSPTTTSSAAYSTNGGVTWTATNMPAGFADQWTSVVYSPQSQQFVAIGAAGNVAISLTTGGLAAAHSANTGVRVISLSTTPDLNHWGSAVIMDGGFTVDRTYTFTYNVTNFNVTPVAVPQTAFMMRLAPSLSNAITGELGAKELINRAQVLLQNMYINVNNPASRFLVQGLLNPNNVLVASWKPLNTAATYLQPSFTQFVANTGFGSSAATIQFLGQSNAQPGQIANAATGGEQIFSIPVTQTNSGFLDLSLIKEITSMVLPGTGSYPNGNEVLAINFIPVNPQTSGGNSNVDVQLTYTESQA